MTLPTPEELLAALAKTEKLIPAPRTLGRALQLLRNPNSGLDAIAELIRADSALAVDVLRCANSAYYNRQSRVAEVGDAVQVIGFRETTRLLTLVAVQQSTNRNLGSYGIAAEDFWAESLFNGLFLEALTRRVGGVDSGEAYTTGLLRFLGRLAIDQALQDLGCSLFWDGTTPLADWEREYVGLTQAEVGARLLRSWRFPEPIVLAIELQDVPVLPDGDLSPPLVQAAHFAAQVLPAGCGLCAIDSLEGTVIECPTEHPFARARLLTAETVTAVCHDAHRAFVAIRETLYRPVSV